MKDVMRYPIITPTSDGLWELVEPFAEVPKGYKTDGATIPRLLWRVLGAPMETKTIGPAIRHDWHYDDGDLSRADADAEFYEDLRDNGVSVWRAWLFWVGVRLFGWIHYNYGN